MANREPKGASILAARLAKAYPSLSAYSAETLAEELERIGNAFQRHETRRCNGASDIRRRPDRGELFGYCKLIPLPAGRSADPTAPAGRTWTQDEEAEQAAAKRIDNRLTKWRQDLTRLATSQRKPIIVRSDAGGLFLTAKLPGEQEARAV